MKFRISEGVGVLEKNPFRGGGMDVFWNYTMYFHVWVLFLREIDNIYTLHNFV